jgi:hypothetical protein
MARYVSAGEGVGERETAVDPNGVSIAMARIQENARLVSRAIYREAGLAMDVESRYIKTFEEYLRRLLTVRFRAGERLRK